MKQKMTKEEILEMAKEADGIYAAVWELATKSQERKLIALAYANNLIWDAEGQWNETLYEAMFSVAEEILAPYGLHPDDSTPRDLCECEEGCEP